MRGRLFGRRIPIAALAAALAVATLPLSAQASPAVGTWIQTQVNAATQAGVAYIDTQQNVDGSYGSGPTVSNTGMALVAYSVVANGSFSNLSLTYQAHVKKAITWLLSQQGLSGDWADFGVYRTYSTGIALAGLSSYTAVDPGVSGAITNGRAFLQGEFQGPAFTGCSSADGSPTADYCGGWNYDTGRGRSDESNTGYAMFGLQLTGGVPASLVPDNLNWQHHIQEISTNPFAARNDGGGDYQPGEGYPPFASNANDTGTMLFGLGYDGVPGTDPNVQAGLKLGQDALDVYEGEAPSDTMVYHTGASEDGTCHVFFPRCDWSFATGEGGYHYSIFSLTKGLGEYIPPVLTDPTNWYAKVVDLLLTQQNPDGSWPQDGRDDGNTLIATAFAVSALGLVAVEAPISNATGVPFSATEGTNSCGAVATFTDSDSKAVATDYTATIKWGDGITTNGTVFTDGNGNFTVSGCHTYAEEGSQPITVTITDADMTSNTATVTTTATINDAALSAQCAMAAVIPQSYTGPTATFNDASSTGTLSDFTTPPGGATIDWGDSTTSAGIVTGGPGNAPYTVSGSHTYSSTGTFTVTTSITDIGGSTASASCTVLVFAFAPGGAGSFVIGDQERATGTHVMFWGAQWWKNNSTSHPSKAPSFKGFAESPTTPSCVTGWNADPGNSTPPPAGPLPAFMAVIVTDSYAKSGSTISGDTVHIVIVQTDPGYQANPGHPGTGTVVAQVC